MNFIYIGCYFMPYMLLAFIHDPLLTTFTYLTLVLFTVCIYLICLGVCNLYNYKFKHKTLYSNNRGAEFPDYLLYSCMVWAMAFSLSMFLFVVTLILTLGAFDDFQDLKYLIPSLPLAVISLFLIRPLYKLTSNKKQEDLNRTEEGIRNVHVQEWKTVNQMTINLMQTKPQIQIPRHKFCLTL